MSQTEQFREQIDACRPGSDDLALPALAELAAAAEQDRALAGELVRSQQFDRAVAAAMHDVAVPAGLLDRLLVATSTAVPASEVSLPLITSDDSPSPGNYGRRTWLVAGGSTALVALLALSGSYLWLRPGRVVSQDEIGGALEGWQDVLARQSGGWRGITSGQAPWGFPLDPAIRGKPIRWQTIRPTSGWSRSSSVTAIDLTPAGRPMATLFVVRLSAKYGVPPIPSNNRRLSVSRGFAAAAWQKPGSNLLFVLVVDEDRGQRLNDFLQRPLEA